jgi:hypothetical protein
MLLVHGRLASDDDLQHLLFRVISKIYLLDAVVEFVPRGLWTALAVMK